MIAYTTKELVERRRRNRARAEWVEKWMPAQYRIPLRQGATIHIPRFEIPRYGR